MNSTQPEYWDEKSPWWRAAFMWENANPLSPETIQELQTISEQSEDRRIRQLCSFLLQLCEDEPAAIQRNDSFTQYLLRRRNQRHLKRLVT